MLPPHLSSMKPISLTLRNLVLYVRSHSCRKSTLSLIQYVLVCKEGYKQVFIYADYCDYCIPCAACLLQFWPPPNVLLARKRHLLALYIPVHASTKSLQLIPTEVRLKSIISITYLASFGSGNKWLSIKF